MKRVSQNAEPVPHVTPLAAEAFAAEQMAVRPGHETGDDALNQQIVDTFGELIRNAHDLGQDIAAECGLTVSDSKALFLLQAPMTMKELGLRMGCDPSFVTTVADALEKRGLARREPSDRDRRSKNLVLTPDGEALRAKLWTELSARAPWCATLDTSERTCLLTLMKKMLRSRAGR